MEVQTPSVFKPLYELNKYRYKVGYGGRGGAKSWGFADALLTLGAMKPLRIVCTREIQNSIKDSVHRLLSDRIRARNLSEFYEVLNTEIKGKNGTLFLFGGLKHNPETIKSLEGADIAWVEEANTVSEKSWKILIPTIRKANSEIWVSFNPDQKHDAAYQRFVINPPPDAWVKKVSWRDNPWFPEVLKKELEHLKNTDYEDYLNVWEGELKEIADGAVFGKQIIEAKKQERICNIPIEKMCEVHTFWDLGRNDPTAIWFMQQVGKEYRFIDYYENRLEDLDHYAQVLKEKAYLYGTHYLPHDGDHAVLGSGNKTRREMLEDVGISPIEVVPRISNIQEGIEMTRKAFANCWFDKKRCERGLDALASYHYKYKEDEDTYSQKPVHDWASNGADAFRQFAQGYQGNMQSIYDDYSTSNSNWRVA